jgi:DNA-binding response OmpR family regulator
MGNKSILIVEDDQVLAETLRYNLAREGYTVRIALDGTKAIEMARTDPPDLVILDLMLPGLDGLAVCRTVTELCDPLILMLTARSSEVDKIVGLESGADDYLTKPFSLGELLARIRALFRRTERPLHTSGTVLTAGDLVVDVAGRKATLHGQELALTNKEFDLLVELMRNKGMVMSRDLLLERVWGYDFYGDSRTVDVHIRWIREKVEPDPAHPRRIVTVRGIGYRFEG